MLAAIPMSRGRRPIMAVNIDRGAALTKEIHPRGVPLLGDARW